MHFAYILRSVSDPEQYYVGLAKDVKTRLTDHNAGKSRHTKKHLPCKIISIHGFQSREQAALFEKYPKSGSGRAFADRPFK